MALDTDVVNLAKAIRQIESGNRAVLPAEGAELGGASRYQYTTGTWKGVAQKYLGDANAPLTLENENKATYLRIKDWKDAGYNPAQIASMWNAGEGKPNAYKENWRGVNAYGVAYDTPAYVKKVYAEYQKQKQLNPPVKTTQPTTTQPVQAEQPGLLKRIGSALISSETGLAKTLGGALSTLTPDYKAAQASQVALDDLNVKLGQKIIEQKKLGQDTSRLENLYKQNTGRVFDPSFITGGAIDKTTGQVIGEAAGTALDVATAGTYGTLAKGAKTGQLLTKSPTIARVAEKAGLTVTKPLATTTALPTAIRTLGKKELAKSVATGAGIGYGYDVTSKLQEGQTGISAFTPGLGTVVGAAIPLAAKGIQKTGVLASKAEKTAASLAEVENEIAKIERNYAKTRPLVDKTAPARKLLAESDLLPSAIQDGTIYTRGKGGAIDKFFDATIGQIEGQGGIVRIGLQNEGIAISPNIVREQLRKSILNSNLEGAELKRALNKVDDEIEGLVLKSNSEGNIKLENLQDAKIFTTKNIDYTKPTSKLEAKAFANAYKTLIENNSKLNIKEVNSELAKYYDAIDLLEMLDGKKVKGGKLGTYAARISGNIAGSAIGGAIGGLPGMAVGTVLGGETAAKIQGILMSKTFGKGVGQGLKKSSILEKAGQEFPQARKLLPEKASVKQTPIILPEKLPTIQGQVKSPSDLRTSLPINKSVAKVETKVDPLIQEAKKYKSAEEFVKAQGKPTYHGTQSDFEVFAPKSPTEILAGKAGTYLTTNSLEAAGFGKNIKETYLSPNAKIKVEYVRDMPANIKGERIFKARREGYDAVQLKGVDLLRGNRARIAQVKEEIANLKPKIDKLNNEMIEGKITLEENLNHPDMKKWSTLLEELNPTHTVVFNTDIIKTKSQLTDIWNKANKGLPKKKN